MFQMNTMTQSLARCITVEFFHSVNKQEDADAQRRTELSLRDVLHELHGVLGEATCIALCEVTVGEGDSVSQLARVSRYELRAKSWESPPAAG
jgi:hypothetical protein